MKKTMIIVFALAFALCMPALAFAAGGNGSGGGTGGGGGNGSGGGNGGGSADPLVVASTSIENGSQINAGDTITLVFNKNVCEASVRESNKALVQVKDSQGAAVPAVVTLADDQVEPNKKNDIVVGFETAPPAGTYTLVAKAGITSKSGDSLAQDYVLEFKVAAQAPSTSASASASASSASSSSASAPAQQQGPDVMIFVVGGIILVVVIVGAVVLFNRKK